MIKKTKIDFGSNYQQIREYIEAAKAEKGMTLAGALGQLVLLGKQADLLKLGGRWSSDKSERKAARKAERAERKAAKPPAPAQEQEPPKDDAWTHSEWMAELRRLYMAKADTLEGDELKQFCEACLPKFKVEADARRLYEELKADDW